jgi:hypothetical protein
MELSQQQFYHASNHDFSPGKELTPEGARRSHVFYTDSLPAADRYGSNVYRVTPSSPGEDRRRDFGTSSEYLTRTSLRVEGKVHPDEVKAAVREHKKKRDAEIYGS